MKQGTNAKGWPPKPWTIIAMPYLGKGGGIAHYHYAFNMLTRATGPYRTTHEAAMRDIEEDYTFQKKMAEPWGV